MLNLKLFVVLSFSILLGYMPNVQLLFWFFFFYYFKDIRLSDNPIADPGRGGLSRFVLIARLAKIEMLNGSEVNSSSCIKGLLFFLALWDSNESDVFLSNNLSDKWSWKKGVRNPVLFLCTTVHYFILFWNEIMLLNLAFVSPSLFLISPILDLTLFIAVF